MSAEYSAVPRKAGKRITAKERGINKYMYETAEYSALLFWDSFPLYHALIFFLFYISPVCSFPVFPAVFSAPLLHSISLKKKIPFRENKNPRGVFRSALPPPLIFLSTGFTDILFPFLGSGSGVNPVSCPLFFFRFIPLFLSVYVYHPFIHLPFFFIFSIKAKEKNKKWIKRYIRL